MTKTRVDIYNEVKKLIEEDSDCFSKYKYHGFFIETFYSQTEVDDLVYDATDGIDID